MRVGPELRGWLGDREAQRHARANADIFATAWNTGPANEGFIEAMAQLADRSATAITETLCALFNDNFALDALVEELGKALRQDPFFEPPCRQLNSEIHSGLMLFEDEHVSIAAGVTDVARLAGKKRKQGGRGSIAFSGHVEVFKFVKAGGARLGFWEAPRITADFIGAQAGRCRRLSERAIQDGEILVMDGRYQSFIIESASANLVVLQATVKPDRAPVAVEYDRNTGEYLGCSAADDSASRIQMITTLLRKLDWVAAFPVIAEFLDHPNFFVRWHVMRELLGLDAQRALPSLHRMAESDPHPETRRAAQQVLERLERSSSGNSQAA